MYDQIRTKIVAEAILSPSKRTQVVPCAFCGLGGNGDKSCSCGWDQKRYSKFKGCFAGQMLEKNPEVMRYQHSLYNNHGGRSCLD
jgi:hypothetical protein